MSKLFFFFFIDDQNRIASLRCGKNNLLISCVFKLMRHEYELAGRKFVIRLFLF